MKVKELIEELSKYDGDKEVCVVDWDNNIYSFEGINNEDYMLEEYGVCLKFE